MTPGITAFPALARASAVRGMSFTLFLRPKAFVPAIGIVMGPPVLVGRGAIRELGVMGLVIMGACGRLGAVIVGRFGRVLVPALRLSGVAGGFEAKEGITEAPITDWSFVEGAFVARTGEFVVACTFTWAPTERPRSDWSAAEGLFVATIGLVLSACRASIAPVAMPDSVSLFEEAALDGCATASRKLAARSVVSVFIGGRWCSSRVFFCKCPTKPFVP